MTWLIEKILMQIKSRRKVLFTNIFLFTTSDVTIKNLGYTKINNVNPIYLIINKINGYNQESNRSKYLALVPTDQSKEV